MVSLSFTVTCACPSIWVKKGQIKQHQLVRCAGVCVCTRASPSAFLAFAVCFVVRARLPRAQYELDCSGPAAYTASCEELKENMDRAAGDIQLFVHLPMVVYVQGKRGFHAREDFICWLK